MKNSLFIIIIGLLIICLFSCSKPHSSIESKNETINTLENTTKSIKCIDVALGNGNAFYLSDNGDLYCVGYNWSSILGLGRSEDEINVPNKLPLDKKIKLVAAGLNICAVLTIDNEVYIFGVNPKHIVNLDKIDYESEVPVFRTPQKIDTSKISDDIIDIKTQGLSLLILTRAGKVFGYGANHLNQISNEDVMYYETAVEIDMPENVIKIGNSISSWFLTESGKLYSKGDINDKKLTLQAENVKDFSCGVSNILFKYIW
jgi:alpha-tubulin suppressor-like RCC1 family protein